MNLSVLLKQYLMDDSFKMVFPTDKNLGLCVVDTEWYKAQARLSLGDRSTYNKTAFDPSSVVNELVALVFAANESGFLTR